MNKREGQPRQRHTTQNPTHENWERESEELGWMPRGHRLRLWGSQRGPNMQRHGEIRIREGEQPKPGTMNLRHQGKLLKLSRTRKESGPSNSCHFPGQQYFPAPTRVLSEAHKGAASIQRRSQVLVARCPSQHS